jgi:hypothetical protein
MRKILYGSLALLYIVHTDWWFWNDATLFLNLPVGFIYHVGLCFAAAVLMFLFVKYAWPSHLDVEKEN